MTSHKAKSVRFAVSSFELYILINLLSRAFFKKWLELEKRIGDEEGVEVVKQKAIEWTQRAASNGSS
jgi:hypothetical protein